MEEWVPTLEMLTEMKRDEPNRFSSGDDTHEGLCMMLYSCGKSREEVFQEVSSRLSTQERKEHYDQQADDDFDIIDDLGSDVDFNRKMGLLPSLKEEQVYRKQWVGGFRLLTGTSQGSRFDVPPKAWIEEELIAVGARSEFEYSNLIVAG